MMKSKFFSILATFILMFVGVSLSAQNYVSSAEALNRVNSELVTLTQDLTGIKTSDVNPVSASAAYVAEQEKSLKIQYAQKLKENLQGGSVTSVSIDNANAAIASTSTDQSFQDALQKADLYFKNLLQ
ncbi:MAG TPA: hypothetical protein PK047_07725 [Saprospiraceae bacterium]|nr:hypothetical protein [Saprospiraceae bacterium]HRO08743.1 hypothetical protein [Saprospiraceae bacterium]